MMIPAQSTIEASTAIWRAPLSAAVPLRASQRRSETFPRSSSASSSQAAPTARAAAYCGVRSEVKRTSSSRPKGTAKNGRVRSTLRQGGSSLARRAFRSYCRAAWSIPAQAHQKNSSAGRMAAAMMRS